MSNFLAYVGSTSGGLKKTIRDALDYVQWEKEVQPDSVIFLKPNFTYPYYKEGITTSPAVLEPLLAILKSRARRVIVGESNGGNRSFSADIAFKNHGMHDMCQRLGVELVNLSSLPNSLIEETIAGKRVQVRLPDLLLKQEIDCFIDVPVLKVHVMTGVTIGIKNLWGCFPDTMRGLYHENFDFKISMMAKLLNPKITLIDATYALDKHGPMWGEAVKLDLLLAANNVVVADALGASIMGFDPQKVGHIRLAAQTILGTMDLAKVTLNQDWKPFRRQFTVSKTINDRFAVPLFHSHFLSKIVFTSPLTGLVYKVGHLLRSRKEKATATDIKNNAYFH